MRFSTSAKVLDRALGPRRRESIAGKKQKRNNTLENTY